MIMKIEGIDLFAGLGGNTEGATQADVNIVWAANHWPIAVEFHKANHPNVVHTCQDLQQADWSQVPAHDIFFASPECKGHTNARGKEQKHHDASRSTAWAVIDCAEYHRSEVGLVENVPGFLNWILYPSWKDAMQRLGYTLSPVIVDAADFGVPQNRERLFIVCTRSKNQFKFKFPNKQHVPVESVIEWGNYKWSLINKPGRSKNTLKQIENARRNGFGDQFVIPYYGSGSGETGRCLSRPLGTVTTRDRWAIVNGDKMRMFQPSEYKKVMGFRHDYELPKRRDTAIHLLGNAVCPPVVTELVNQLKAAV